MLKSSHPKVRILPRRTANNLIYPIGLFLLYFSLASIIATNAPRQTIFFDEIGTFHDPGDRIPLEMIPDQTFTRTSAEATFGLLEGSLWYRLSLDANENSNYQHALLQVSIPNLDTVTLYYKDANNIWHRSRTGDTIPYIERAWPSQRLSLIVPLRAIQDDYLYLRIANPSGSTSIMLEVGDVASMQALQAKQTVKDLLFFIALFFFFAAGIYLTISLKDLLLLNYSIQVLLYLLAALSYTGYLAILNPETATNQVTTFLFPFATAAAKFFHAHFLRRLGAQRLICNLLLTIAALDVVIAIASYIDQSNLPIELIWILTASYVALAVIAAATIEQKSKQSKVVIIIFYILLATTIFAWLAPATGHFMATNFAFSAPALQGIFNATVISVFFIDNLYNHRKRNRISKLRSKIIRSRLSQSRRFLREQNDLIWTLTHEIGTATSILRMTSELGTHKSANSERAKRAISALEEIVEVFQSGALHETNTEAMTLHPVDLVGLVEDEMHSRDTTTKSSRFTLGVHGDGPRKICSNEGYLRIIIRNILSNAEKYSPSHSAIQVDVFLEERSIGISIVNAFPHAKNIDFSRVFDRFYRGPQATNTRGLGIGLYIVRRMLLAIDGRCSMGAVDEDKVRMELWLTR